MANATDGTTSGGDQGDGGDDRHVSFKLTKDWAKMTDAEKDAAAEKITAEMYDGPARQD